MKMISNDLRSSCRAMLIGAYQEGGSTTRNSIFHDILDNSDVVATIPIYGDYKLTVNLWETDRTDVYETVFYAVHGSGKYSTGEEYAQGNYPIRYRIVHIVFVAWNGDTPLYAQLSGSYSTLSQSYSPTVVRENLDPGYPYEVYLYLSSSEKYIKGSGALASEIDHFEFKFNTISGSTWFDNIIYPCDSSGNHINLKPSFKSKYSEYSAVYPECEWTDSDTGTTSTISDTTQLPTIELKNSYEKSNTIYGMSNIYLLVTNYCGTYSDFETAEQLIAAHGEIVEAICAANGYDYKTADILLPESEE